MTLSNRRIKKASTLAALALTGFCLNATAQASHDKRDRWGKLVHDLPIVSTTSLVGGRRQIPIGFDAMFGLGSFLMKTALFCMTVLLLVTPQLMSQTAGPGAKTRPDSPRRNRQRTPGQAGA